LRGSNELEETTRDVTSGGRLAAVLKGSRLVLGHTKITTTQRYLHLVAKDVQGPHRRLSILNRLR